MIKLKHLLPECSECGRDWNHGHDHEAGMAKNELRDMISNASKIDSMVSEEDNLPGWVSAYISLAADYMHSVAEYLGGESSRMDEPGPGYGLEEDLDAPQGNSYEEVIGWLDNTYPDPSQYPAFVSAFKKELVYLPEPTRKEWIARFNADFGSLSERKKPSAGLSKVQKSTVAKKAAAGKDIGKKGKGFEKVAKAAEKQYGSKEAGEKVAAAAMWKNIKRK
jgi:hypothetical protein